MIRVKWLVAGSDEGGVIGSDGGGVIGSDEGGVTVVGKIT